jgi:hypothetical protein
MRKKSQLGQAVVEAEQPGAVLVIDTEQEGALAWSACGNGRAWHRRVGGLYRGGGESVNRS